MAATIPPNPKPPSFRLDVEPVIFRAGCNSGGCHGAAAGKDGFHLSLFGYDPIGDHFRLTRELAGRRINLATPNDCLLVNKATGNVPHTGGRRIEPYEREQIPRLGLRRELRHAMGAQAVGNNVADAPLWIERGMRVLKNHLDLTPTVSDAACATPSHAHRLVPARAPWIPQMVRR